MMSTRCVSAVLKLAQFCSAPQRSRGGYRMRLIDTEFDSKRTPGVQARVTKSSSAMNCSVPNFRAWSGF